MFFLDGGTFDHLNLVLIIIDGLPVDLDGELVSRRGLKETWNVIGYTHEVDGGRPFVREGH